MPPAFFSSPFGFAAPEAEQLQQQQQQGPTPGEGQGFVLLEGSEAIGAEMLRQAQEEAEGQAEGQEYELAQLNRRPDAATHGDSGSEDGSEADEEEDTLSLSELPKDLRGLCRRLRGEQPSSDEEEDDEVEDEPQEQEGAEGSPVTAAAAANRRKGKGSSKKPARRTGATAAKRANTPAQAAFLCWAWPVSAREALFWLVAAAFLASFALIALGGAGGRYRAHYHAMGMGRTRAGMARRACPASAAPSVADPFFGFFGGSPPSAWASSPPGQEGEGNHNGAAPLFVAPAEARRLLARAQGAEAEAGALKAERRDREEELAWMRSTQYGLEVGVWLFGVCGAVRSGGGRHPYIDPGGLPSHKYIQTHRRRSGASRRSCPEPGRRTPSSAPTPPPPPPPPPAAIPARRSSSSSRPPPPPRPPTPRPRARAPGRCVSRR